MCCRWLREAVEPREVGDKEARRVRAESLCCCPYMVVNISLVAAAMSRWPTSRDTMNECRGYPGIHPAGFWEQPGKLIRMFLYIHTYKYTERVFMCASVAVTTTRGVCGIWKFRRRSSTRKDTVKESMTSTSTPTGHWLPLGKRHVAVLLHAFQTLWLLLQLPSGQ